MVVKIYAAFFLTIYGRTTRYYSITSSFAQHQFYESSCFTDMLQSLSVSQCFTKNNVGFALLSRQIQTGVDTRRWAGALMNQRLQLVRKGVLHTDQWSVWILSCRSIPTESVHADLSIYYVSLELETAAPRYLQMLTSRILELFPQQVHCNDNLVDILIPWLDKNTSFLTKMVVYFNYNT